MTPVCGRTGASSSSSASSEAKNTDKIYFFDQQQEEQSIHTEEMNGIIITCFADGTIINTTSAADRTGNGKRDVVTFDTTKI